MKKIYYIAVIIVFITLVKNHYDYRIDKGNPCVARAKIEEKTSEYEKVVYDSEGNLIFGGYDRLSKLFYDEIVQNGKYKLYLFWNGEKKYINNYEELEKYHFPDVIIDRYLKNNPLGQDLYMIVERSSDNTKVFQIKRYQIYPYKKMVNTRYSGIASIVVQYKCELEKK